MPSLVRCTFFSLGGVCAGGASENRYEHIHVRLAVAIPGHRHFWEGATPLFFRRFSNRLLIIRLAERFGAECLPITPISEAWRVWAFDRMSAAKDGRRQAHMGEAERL